MLLLCLLKISLYHPIQFFSQYPTHVEPTGKKFTVSQKYSNVPTSLSGTPCKSNDKYTQKEGSVIYCWLVTHWIIFGPCNTPFNGRPTYVLQVLAYRWLYPTQVILAQHSYCLLKFLILDHLLYTSTSCGCVAVEWRGKATSGQNIWQRSRIFYTVSWW